MRTPAAASGGTLRPSRDAAPAAKATGNLELTEAKESGRCQPVNFPAVNGSFRERALLAPMAETGERQTVCQAQLNAIGIFTSGDILLCTGRCEPLRPIASAREQERSRIVTVVAKRPSLHAPLDISCSTTMFAPKAPVLGLSFGPGRRE